MAVILLPPRGSLRSYGAGGRCLFGAPIVMFCADVAASRLHDEHLVALYGEPPLHK